MMTVLSWTAETADSVPALPLFEFVPKQSWSGSRNIEDETGQVVNGGIGIHWVGYNGVDGDRGGIGVCETKY